MTSKQFTIRFVCGNFLLFALVGLFNRVVDPFWYYRDIEIKGFNAIKTKFGGFERQVKPALLIRDQPEAIILGSSYSEIGLDPTNSLFTNHGQLKGMNFALARAEWDMVLCNFDFAVKHAHIKRVVVGFHPGALPVADCKKALLSLGQINIKELLFSATAFSASLKTILRQRAKDITHTREGMFYYFRGDPAVINRFREDLPIHSKQFCLNPTGNRLDGNLDKKTLDLSGLESMIDMAKKNGIELVLYAYPRHAYSLELDHQCGGQNLRWQAMKQIATLIDSKNVEGVQVRAWQFYGYNDITAEQIGAETKYWQDPAHFNFEMGNMMMEDMFGNARDKPLLGKYISSSYIEADYQYFLRERSEYLKRHPEFQSNLQKLLPQK